MKLAEALAERAAAQTRLAELQGRLEASVLVQEGEPFDRAVMDQLLDLGAVGCAELTRLQTEALR